MYIYIYIYTYRERYIEREYEYIHIYIYAYMHILCIHIYIYIYCVGARGMRAAPAHFCLNLLVSFATRIFVDFQNVFTTCLMLCSHGAC